MTPRNDWPEDLRSAIIDRFGAIATAPERERRFPVGPDSAKRLGYDAAEVDALPHSLTASFCGVGNPFAMGEPGPGRTVLDLGCGSGFDTLLAARRVGSSGRAIGVDLTPAMIARARRNAALLEMTNVAFWLAEIERVPLCDGSVDLVISNGVLNLCPDKPRVLGEVYRLLKPGGRLQMADILLEPHVTPAEVASKGSWSD
jgi:arsenite methyltransferase